MSQDFTDLELIVIDDGSTDRTLAIAQDIAKDDARLKVVTQANSGSPAEARNRGLAMASGSYVSFLDADDYYLPGRVGTLISALEEHPRWVAAFHDLQYVRDGQVMPGSYLSDAEFLSRANEFLGPVKDDWRECTERFYVFQSLVYGALHTQSVMIAVDRFGPGTLRFDERFVIGEDIDLWIRVGMRGPMGFVNKCLSCYRQHDTNITKSKLEFLRGSVMLHENNYQRVVPHLSGDEVLAYECKIASYHHELGYLRLLAGQTKEARMSYRDALRWMPSKRFFGSYLKSLMPSGVWHVSRQAAQRLRAWTTKK